MRAKVLREKIEEAKREVEGRIKEIELELADLRTEHEKLQRMASAAEGEGDG